MVLCTFLLLTLFSVNATPAHVNLHQKLIEVQDMQMPLQQLMAVPDGMAKDCNGSVTLYEGSEETVVTKDEDIKPSIGVEKVVVEGCGCFTLYDRKGGRGRSFFLDREGERIMKMRVRSVRRVKCDSYV